MNTPEWLFYLLAGLTLVSALLVVANPFSRNPVTSAMFLVLTIFWMAGLFVLLHAFFLAAIQVLVYAGAVMVLFLFVIMLLNLKEEEKRKLKWILSGLAVLAVGAIAGVMLSVLQKLQPPGATPVVEGSTVLLGKTLFGPYVLPFEVISLLLLVAMIGAVLFSKKELK